MPAPFKLVRIASLKSVPEFRRHLDSLGLALPCDEQVLKAPVSPLAQLPSAAKINGRHIGNRVAVHPMEGWDAQRDGRVTPEVLRRWSRFGESGAKLICGGEAMAVRPDGRANPNQLIIIEAHREGLENLAREARRAHREKHGADQDLVIGFQLTHSGRFCRPNDKKKLEPRIAYRHSLLDKKFQVESDSAVLTDLEIAELIGDYIKAARVAWNAGADFVDIKHCHGYLLHEFLSAFTRPGRYGGSFENRTRILREIIAGIRADGNPIDIGVRLSAFDFVPFRPDPAQSQPGKPGPGIPEDFKHCLPYCYGFGVKQSNPIDYDLTEPALFLRLCQSLGVKIVNLSAGSPYYNPHIQRPAAYPPSDGYQPSCDPLIDVVRQFQAVRKLKAEAGAGLIIVGTGYSYLQEYLPHVAQALTREGWTDMVGLGRMILSYPTIISDALSGAEINPKLICRTFSDCTTAPRNGIISGCYPLDKYYTTRPEAQELKEVKKGRPAA